MVRRVLIAVVALLVCAPAAQAGGWATVGLSSTPQGTAPGQAWNVNVTVLQHGLTPLEGVTPLLTIRQGATSQTVKATKTGKPGVYRASVVFPRGGKWTYQIEDGFIHPAGVPTVRLTLAEVAQRAHETPESFGEGIDVELESLETYDGGKGSWSAGTHFCQVEIDINTGQVKISRYLVVEDCGRVVNPMLRNANVKAQVRSACSGATSVGSNTFL